MNKEYKEKLRDKIVSGCELFSHEVRDIVECGIFNLVDSYIEYTYTNSVGATEDGLAHIFEIEDSYYRLYCRKWRTGDIRDYCGKTWYEDWIPEKVYKSKMGLWWKCNRDKWGNYVE